MPNVVVYVRAEDWRRLEGLGQDPAEWVRGVVKEKLGVRPQPGECSEVHRRGWRCDVCGWFEP